MCSVYRRHSTSDAGADLQGHSILELVQEHLQLTHADHKVRQTELVLYIPAKRTKLQTLLYTTANQHQYKVDNPLGILSADCIHAI